MKPEEFMRAMGDIPSHWVIDAETAGRRAPRWMKWGSIAACVCCVAALWGFGLSRLWSSEEEAAGQALASMSSVEEQVIVSTQAISPSVTLPSLSEAPSPSQTAEPEQPEQQAEVTEAETEAAPSAAIQAAAAPTAAAASPSPSATPSPTASEEPEPSYFHDYEDPAIIDNAPVAYEVRDSVYGLGMDVPEEYLSDVVCNEGSFIFSFYEPTSKETGYPGDGFIWGISVYTPEEFCAEFELDSTEWLSSLPGPEIRMLGKTEDYIYVVTYPSGVRYSDETQEAYERYRVVGKSLLGNFLDFNGIEGNPLGY